jgi:hypothetical protein
MLQPEHSTPRFRRRALPWGFRPVANIIKGSTGSWHLVVLTTIMNITVVAIALFILKPMRARMMAND